jgi:Zn-dependent protease with chaperone function
MENQKFEALVSRLEETARKSPGQYVVSVIAIATLGFLILGLAIGFSLLSAALLVGMVAAVILTGGKALIVLAKLGKLIVVLALPAWTMVRSAVTLLFSRFPAPQGRVLKPQEAPALFARLAELRRRMKGPRVHTVLLTDELNASIVQHPRFGLFGWEKNYLILGLPLLQVLSEEEALAVATHEYGHLSGHHSRLGGFIYRFRSAWGRLQHLSEQWDDWGSRLIARLFRWYAPYFNAYTFVLARQNEYLADQTAAEVAGARNAANALMRVSIASQFEQEEFWPSIDRRVASEPEPPSSRSTYWAQSIHAILDKDMRARFLDAANQRDTNHLDTHPALRDRLAAMGMTADANAACELKPLDKNAATVWLGASLGTIKSEFDRTWQEGVAEKWRSRHAYLRERGNRLAALERQETLSLDEKWERISLLDELHIKTELLPLLDELLTEVPDHLSARFRRGTLLLLQDNESGIADLESVMAKDASAILAGCEAAWRFYQSRAPQKAEQYSQRWRERSDYIARVQAELQRLPADATLAPPELDEETLNAIRRILKEHGKHIRQAYIIRRLLKTDNNVSDYVLAFETSRFTLGEKGPDIVKRISRQEFPLHMFIVHLGTPPYKQFRKSIKRMKLEPLEFR